MLSNSWSKISAFFVRRRNVVISSVLVVAAVLGVAFIEVLRDKGSNKLSTSAKPAGASLADPPTVSLIQPQVRKIVRVVGQPSFVQSYERTSIYPKMTAYINKWNVDIGDRVKKGDVLATLFVPELVEEWKTRKATVQLDKDRIELARELLKVAQADVQSYEAQVTEARAFLGQYQAQVDRWGTQVKRLTVEVDKGVVDSQVLLETQNQWKSSIATRNASKATILKAQANLLSKSATKSEADVAIDVARSTLAVAESEAKRLEALIGYLTLTAPFDGVIAVRNANTGDFVLPATGDPTAMQRSSNISPNDAAPIYVVDRIDVVRVFVDIPEQDANYVQKGTTATVQIKSFRNQWIPAKVTRTSWALNVKSRTLRAEIDLPNTNAQILPGMYAFGKVVIERSGIRTLPLSAICYNGETAFYWRCEKNNQGKEQTMRTEVQTGITDGKWIEVIDRQRPMPAKGEDAWVPIDGSEQVIVADDYSILTDGQLVRLRPSEDKEKLASVPPSAP